MFSKIEEARNGQRFVLNDVINAIPWNNQGLIAAIAQQYNTKEVLMLAWMNLEALEETLLTGRACYWSRSRGCLWRKGETSGCTQEIHSINLDCDGDAVLLCVDQQGGGACHTGRSSCFYNKIDGDEIIVSGDPVNVKY